MHAHAASSRLFIRLINYLVQCIPFLQKTFFFSSLHSRFHASVDVQSLDYGYGYGYSYGYGYDYSYGISEANHESERSGAGEGLELEDGRHDEPTIPSTTLFSLSLPRFAS